MAAFEKSFNVVMLATSEIRSYARESRRSWSCYCESHGYGFSVCEEKLLPDMHVNWSKIEMMRRALRDCRADWVVLVDADTRVVRPDVILADLLLPHEGKDLIFSADGVYRFGRYFNIDIRGMIACRPGPAPNAGFIMARSTDEVRRFFDRWLELAKGDCRHLADRHPRNQNVLWAGLYQEYRDHIGLFGREIARIGTNRFLDALSMNTDGAFVVHDKRLSRRGQRRGVLGRLRNWLEVSAV